ncbi:sugar phosphate isomerase/epimerase [bacterium]|nr:sugar phosphate isomerase/epimerase [bacterium]
MKLKQVAAQLYTIRDHLKTPADVAASLKKVSDIGYQAVQISGMGPIDESELVKILDGEGLVCCATHEDTQTLLDDPNAVIDRLKKLDCTYTAYPYPSGVELNSLDDVKSFAARLDSSGSVLADAGITLAYHNHHIEFRRFDDELMLDVIYSHTDKRHLQGEIDTYWVQYGGGDPAAWCRKLDGRLPLLHMKDYAVMPDLTVTFAEIGSGNLNWHEIVHTAQGSGCQWYIVEQDECQHDPFESLKISFDYIRNNLIE